MNKVMKGTLNSIFWAVDVLCTPATLVAGMIMTRKSRIKKAVAETVGDVKYTIQLMGDDLLFLTNEEWDGMTNAIAMRHEQRILGDAYIIYRIREYQAYTLGSKYWKNFLESTREKSKDLIKLLFADNWRIKD